VQSCGAIGVCHASASAALERAFYDAHLLAVRAQELTPREFGAWASRIGPPPHVIDQFHHPEDPSILILSNVKKGGKPTGRQDAGSYVHTDYSYLQVPARAPAAPDLAALEHLMTPEQAIELYEANARLALDVIDAAIESTGRVRQLQFAGEEEARAFHRKTAGSAAAATDPQSLMAVGQGAAQEAVDKSMR
jgi:alpha-ketoglutarate-dependent taurine dioxygenase